MMAVALCGCGGVKSRVEKGIERSLPQLIGPAKSYQVSVSGSTAKMLKSKLSRIDIQGEEVRLSNGMQLAKLEVSLTDVEFDSDTRSIRRTSSTTYSATLSEKELERYLRKTHPEIPELTVKLERDCATATAKPELMGLAAELRAESALKVRDNRQLVLDLKRITLGGLPAPGFAREYIEKKANPAFDASQLGYDATINSVSMEPGYITLNGTLDLTRK